MIVKGYFYYQNDERNKKEKNFDFYQVIPGISTEYFELSGIGRAVHNNDEYNQQAQQRKITKLGKHE